MWKLAAILLGACGYEALPKLTGDAHGADAHGNDAAADAHGQSMCAAICGPNGTSDCCSSSVVQGNAPGAGLVGTTFDRSHDVAADNMFPSTASPATVGDFRLDTYEVTVGRFRAFVMAGMGTQTTAPATSTGAHAAIPNSGWDASWTASLVADTGTLKNAVLCDPTYQTWTEPAAGNEALPMDCVTWFEAMAFCIWDGGYLPTEAEWNYAASGGSEHRAYPWSSPAGDTTIDCTYANYDIELPTAGTHCVNATTGGVNRVGSESPKGDGRWGQSDLSGNVFEWNLDFFASYANPCNDCTNLTTSTDHTLRSGGFNSGVTFMRAAFRTFAPASTTARGANAGFRCARAP